MDMKEEKERKLQLQVVLIQMNFAPGLNYRGSRAAESMARWRQE
jgi:hypothetical protein